MSLEGTWDRRFGGWQAAYRRSGSIIETMVIDMNEAQVCTLEQVRQVLAGTQAIESMQPPTTGVGMRRSRAFSSALNTAGCLGLSAARYWRTCSA